MDRIDEYGMAEDGYEYVLMNSSEEFLDEYGQTKEEYPDAYTCAKLSEALAVARQVNKKTGKPVTIVQGYGYGSKTIKTIGK